MTRRQALALAASPLFGQGVATRNVKPLPRGKPSGIPFDAKFTDIAASAGLKAPVIYGGIDRKTYILEAVGCGCAFFDFDSDGWLDILLLSGSRLESSPSEATLRLYRNNRDGTFADVTERAGLRREGWASAVTIGDFDNDGHEDVFITYWGQNVLYRNNGDGTFTDVTAKSGLAVPGTHWGSGCAWIDYDRDGRLDLFVTSYLQFDFDRVPKPGSGPYCKWHDVAVNCGPRGLPPGRSWLYRNNGDGTFTDVSEKSGIAKSRGFYGLTAVAADLDNDGWPDIYVACDSTPSLFFRNNHDGTFREEGVERGIALNEDGMEQAGMGVAIGDYNLDGSLDILKTHFSDDTSILYRNDGRGNFSDETNTSGLGSETRFTGWGAGMADFDNDGLPDLFVATGNVYPEVEAKVPAYPYRTPDVVFRNLGGGRFEQFLVGAPHPGRGCAFGDFDNDGDLDILAVNLNEPPSLLRNDLSGGRHWIKVLLIGAVSNRSAIGARVTARYGGRRQAQEVLSQSSFFSVNDRRLHFGLGNAGKADLEIRWPNGGTNRFANLDADLLYTIHESRGIINKAPMNGISGSR